VRSCRSGRANDKVQTMISTDVMISATIRRPPPATCRTPHATHHARLTLPATCHLPHASRCLAPATQQVSGSSTQEHTWEPWERTAKQAGSVLSSVIRSVSSRLGVCNRVRSGVYFCAYLGAYNEVHLAAWFQVVVCSVMYSIKRT
jgi:hypothetical protein